MIKAIGNLTNRGRFTLILGLLAAITATLLLWAPVTGQEDGAHYQIDGPATADVYENDTLAAAYSLSPVGEPAPGGALVISGGMDREHFEMNGGELRFKEAPDYENPGSCHGRFCDNVYFVKLGVEVDGQRQHRQHDLNVSVRVRDDATEEFPPPADDYVVDICDRTPRVQAKLLQYTHRFRQQECHETTAHALSFVSMLDLRNQGIENLKRGDFDNLPGLSVLPLCGNPGRPFNVPYPDGARVMESPAECNEPSVVITGTTSPGYMYVSEGSSRTYQIGLTDQPEADVTVTVTAGAGHSQITHSPSSLTFTPDDWNGSDAHVAVRNDSDCWGSYRVFHYSATSDDPRYDGIWIEDLRINSSDHDRCITHPTPVPPTATPVPTATPEPVDIAPPPPKPTQGPGATVTSSVRSECQAGGPATVIPVTVGLNGNVDSVLNFLRNNGGDPRNWGDDYIETYVPCSLVNSLAQKTGVTRISMIVPPEPDNP